MRCLTAWPCRGRRRPRHRHRRKGVGEPGADGTRKGLHPGRHRGCSVTDRAVAQRDPHLHGACDQHVPAGDGVRGARRPDLRGPPPLRVVQLGDPSGPQGLPAPRLQRLPRERRPPHSRGRRRLLPIRQLAFLPAHGGLLRLLLIEYNNLTCKVITKIDRTQAYAKV